MAVQINDATSIFGVQMAKRNTGSEEFQIEGAKRDAEETAAFHQYSYIGIMIKTAVVSRFIMVPSLFSFLQG